MDTSKLVQYYALYSIYTATYAVPNVITDADPRFDDLEIFPGWIGNTGWTSNTLDPCPLTGNGASVFRGIECVDGLVTAVILTSNRLTGAFPPEITLLASDGPAARGAGNLQRIDLFNNQYLYNNETNAWMTNLGSTFGKLRVQTYVFFVDLSF